jgi:hypothetical protein
MLLRRFLLALFVIAAGINVGCEKLTGDGYTWKKVGNAAASYTWNWVCRDADHDRCDVALHGLCANRDQLARGEFVRGLWGCAWYDHGGGTCTVWSRFSLDRAKSVKLNGRSHFDHEVGKLLEDGSIDGQAGFGHCAGLIHDGAHPRGV